MSFNEKMTEIANEIRNFLYTEEKLTLDDMRSSISDVWNSGYNNGYIDGESTGWSDGYGDGYNDGIDVGRNVAVEEFCPPFTESGSVVVCDPVADYPLEVISHIEPHQEGSGEPSPDNVRPISGHNEITIMRNGVRHYTRPLRQTVYGGTMNWANRLLESNMECLTFDGTEDWQLVGVLGYGGYVAVSIGEYGLVNTIAEELCSHFVHTSIGSGNNNTGIYITNSNGYNDARILVRHDIIKSLDGWKAYLAEQYAKGTPVQAVFGTTKPTNDWYGETYFVGWSGENTFQSSTGDTTVTGRADPIAIINKLTNAITSLGGDV